ncbi:hypothetical protein EDC04DRAFT_2785346, partial [Pisolithus marmoratus]
MMGVCVTLLPAAALAHGWVSRDAMRTVIVQVMGETGALKCLTAQHILDELGNKCPRQTPAEFRVHAFLHGCRLTSQLALTS